jgi:hypothetical protein
MATKKTVRRPSVPAPASVDTLAQAVIAQLREQGWTPPGAAPARPERPRVVPMQTLVLRVPGELIDALDKRGANRSDTARSILAEGLGITISPPTSGSATPKRRR